ncbi:hypothetical protein FRC12_012979 [Ceratobasidium sp. 428]|nr:hypothetical protein FRC12_012979 [Ceratobasidium sp. 428]
MNNFPEQSIITSGSQSDFRIPTIDPLETRSRFADIISAIARTRKVMVLCGDVASRGAQLPVSFYTAYLHQRFRPPTDTSIGLSKSLDTLVPVNYDGVTRKLSVRNLLKECSPAHVRPEDLHTGKLAAYNRALTSRRIASRQAPSNLFLQYLGLLHDRGHLVTCVTTSFDGFEAEVREGIAKKIVALYGSNRTLRCSTRGCPGLSATETMALDEPMSAEGVAPCKSCTSKCKPRFPRLSLSAYSILDHASVALPYGRGRQLSADDCLSQIRRRPKPDAQVPTRPAP